MYETSIRTWIVSGAVAMAAGIALVSTAGSALHETRIVAGLDRRSVVKLDRVVVSKPVGTVPREVAQACSSGAGTSL